MILFEHLKFKKGLTENIVVNHDSLVLTLISARSTLSLIVFNYTSDQMF